MALEIALTNEEKVQITINPTTSTGKPATLDGAPTWTITSGDATLAVAVGGLSAFLISGDSLGDSTVLVEADADLGQGVETIADTVLLHVNGALAKNLGLAAGPAIPK
jgi:hypothetical protein